MEDGTMIHVVETDKSVAQAAEDLATAVQEHGFGVLHTYDLQATMQEKNVDFPHACQILEVCNPHRAAEVLTADMQVSLALPCRICVFEQDGRTKIGTIRPVQMMEIFAGARELAPVAAGVEQEMLAMIEDAR
jgi:uncharacterized protein (DUF302 family)